MTIAEYCEWSRIEPSDDVLLAASFLQAKGWRFSEDFTIADAVPKAEALLQTEVKPHD